MKCVICGKEFEGYGNNAEPAKTGKCCDDCNMKVVIPIRFCFAKHPDLKSTPENIEKMIKICQEDN